MAARSRSRSPWRAWLTPALVPLDERMRIVIVPMNGRRFPLYVLASDTIDAVKAKIASHTNDVMSRFGDDLGIKPALQRLRFQGAVLNHGSLRDYNIGMGAIVKLRWSPAEYEQSTAGLVPCLAGDQR